MAPRGSRYFGYRLFDFWERHVGLDAKSSAVKQSQQLRAAGYFVRTVKVGCYMPAFCVYRLKNEDSK
jgi:hypothetical protein